MEGQPWRLKVVLPTVAIEDDDLERQKELFAWMRFWVIPAILNAPGWLGPPSFEVLPPEDVRPNGQTE